MPIVNYSKGCAVEKFLTAQYDAFAHGCNCFNTMGAGIAALVARTLRELYQADQRTIKGSRAKMGTFTYAPYKDKANRLYMAYNLYTQYTCWDTKDMLSLVAVHDSFAAINNHMLSKGLSKLVIPAIGAGLARGNWNDISKLINAATPDIQVEVVIWEHEKDPVLLSYLESSN